MPLVYLKLEVAHWEVYPANFMRDFCEASIKRSHPCPIHVSLSDSDVQISWPSDKPLCLQIGLDKAITDQYEVNCPVSHDACLRYLPATVVL
jgi:hypothetical protein